MEQKPFRGPHPTPNSAKRHVQHVRAQALRGNLEIAAIALARLVDRAIHYNEHAAAAAADEMLRQWEDKKNLRRIYAQTFLVGREPANRGRSFRKMMTTFS